MSNPEATSHTPGRTLVVIRHAKAEQWGTSDYVRELTPRGLRDAAAAGEWLGELKLIPDVVLVSGATRTQQTAAAIIGAAAWSITPTVDEGLYAAGPETALDAVRVVDSEARCVVLIGHNPTMATLAQGIDDGDGEVDSMTELLLDFPTSALAVFRYDGAWLDLGEGAARLNRYHVARA